MAKSYRASQYDIAYSPKILRNWEVPRYHCEIPVARLGKTVFIANNRGHIIPGVPRPPPTPWGTYIGTWYLPKRITRTAADKLNGALEHKKLAEECKKKLYQKAIVHSGALKIDHSSESSHEKYEPEKEEEENLENICPIHNLVVEYV